MRALLARVNSVSQDDLHRYAPLSDGEGVLLIRGSRAEGDPPEIPCLSSEYGGRYGSWPVDTAWQCSADLRRCTGGHWALRFERVANGHLVLRAIVEYGRDAPTADGPSVDRALAVRVELCEFHDRIAHGDLSLVGDRIVQWQISEAAEGDERARPRVLCGARARHVGEQALASMAGESGVPERPDQEEPGVGLCCLDLDCTPCQTGFSEPHLIGRHDASGALRIGEDGTQLGLNNLPSSALEPFMAALSGCGRQSVPE